MNVLALSIKVMACRASNAALRSRMASSYDMQTAAVLFVDADTLVAEALFSN